MSSGGADFVEFLDASKPEVVLLDVGKKGLRAPKPRQVTHEQEAGHPP
jgi:hypothetical protein